LHYKILFDDKVAKDLKKIDRVWQKRILSKIKTALAADPHMGKKLVGDLSPFWRLRVGNYRVIYAIDEGVVTVEVIKIRHRKDAYG
jgi:mRNA interferase RelE/StbE